MQYCTVLYYTVLYCTVLYSLLSQVGHEGVAGGCPHEAGHQGEDDEDRSKVRKAGTLGISLMHWMQSQILCFFPFLTLKVQSILALLDWLKALSCAFVEIVITLSSE